MLERDSSVGLIVSAMLLAGVTGAAMDWAFAFLPK
jgi:hypothetical protein